MNTTSIPSSRNRKLGFRSCSNRIVFFCSGILPTPFRGEYSATLRLHFHPKPDGILFRSEKTLFQDIATHMICKKSRRECGHRLLEDQVLRGHGKMKGWVLAAAGFSLRNAKEPLTLPR